MYVYVCAYVFMYGQRVGRSSQSRGGLGKLVHVYVCTYIRMRVMYIGVYCIRSNNHMDVWMLYICRYIISIHTSIHTRTYACSDM